MKARARSIPLAAITLSAALLAACVTTADDVVQLDADHALEQRSSHGLVEATVALEGPRIARGPNDFSITLRAGLCRLFAGTDQRRSLDGSSRSSHQRIQHRQ